MGLLLYILMLYISNNMSAHATILFFQRIHCFHDPSNQNYFCWTFVMNPIPDWLFFPKIGQGGGISPPPLYHLLHVAKSMTYRALKLIPLDAGINFDYISKRKYYLDVTKQL